MEKPKNIELKNFVDEKLEDNWSPEQIAGTLKEEKKFEEIISYESIYDYIYNHSEKQKHFYEHLRTGRKKRQRKFSRKKQKNTVKDRVSIHSRPAEIAEKKEFGH